MKLTTRHDDLVGETIWSVKLDNGLAVYVIPLEGYARKYATFSVHYGSIDNEFVHPETGVLIKVPEGIAHFLEHKMFEEESGNIFDRFSKLGASVNAYTDFSLTSYLFSATDNFEECLEVLLGFVQRPYFTDENVEKEKGIIQQEIRMYEDSPNHQVTQNLLRALYHSHPVRYDIAGTVESIRQISKDTLYTCYETFYHPSNMSVLVAGGINPEQVLNTVESVFAGRRYMSRGPIMRRYPEEPRDVTRSKAHQKMSVSMPLLEIGFKDIPPKTGGQDLLKRDLVSSMVLEMMFGKGSTLYSELYDKGLIDSKFGASYESEPGYGMGIIGGPTPDPSETEKLILSALNRADLVTEADFTRICNKFLGSFVSLFNSPERLAYSFNDYHFKGIQVFEYADVLKRLRFEDILMRKQEFLNEERYAVSTIEPIR